MISPRRADMLRVMIAGGGSGGHLYPGLALREALHERYGGRVDVRFLATDRPLDRRILEREAVEWDVVPGLRRSEAAAAGRPRGGVSVGPSWIGRAPRSFAVAFRHVRDFRPQVMIGLGGFASIPGAVVGRALGVPLYLVEPNVVPGRANRWLATRAREVWTQFEETAALLPARSRACPVGHPIRECLRPVERGEAREWYGLDPAATVVFAFGGSQGAHAINEILASEAKNWAHVLPDVEVLHVAGERDVADVRQAYVEAGVAARVIAYTDCVQRAYSAADLVVARAGAGTIAELARFGLPSVLVPLGSADGHQARNALEMARRGAARVASQSDPQSVVTAVRDLLGNKDEREALARAASAAGRPRAAADAVRRLEDWGDAG